MSETPAKPLTFDERVKERQAEIKSLTLEAVSNEKVADRLPEFDPKALHLYARATNLRLRALALNLQPGCEPETQYNRDPGGTDV